VKDFKGVQNMAIGLNRDELTKLLLTTFNDVQTKLQSEKLTADAGFNPQSKELFNLLQKAAPKATLDELGTMLGVIVSITEVIAVNNEAISRNIPHTDN
jgi:hypothetical protein